MISELFFSTAKFLSVLFILCSFFSVPISYFFQIVMNKAFGALTFLFLFFSLSCYLNLCKVIPFFMATCKVLSHIFKKNVKLNNITIFSYEGP